MKKLAACLMWFLLLPTLGRTEVLTFQELQAEFKREFKIGASADGHDQYRLNSREDFARARARLKRHGSETFFGDLVRFEIFGEDGLVRPALKPFNVFARMITGDMQVPYGDVLDMYWRDSNDQELVEFSRLFMMAKNLPANDAAWNDVERASRGQASMSQRHRFLIPRDRHWSYFNALTIGLADGAHELRNSIDYLEKMKRAALAFIETERSMVPRDSSMEWSKNIGLYFHCFPFNSVQYLHLHIVDLDSAGPAFDYYHNKNLSIDDVLDQLKAEASEWRNIDGRDGKKP